MPWRDTRCWRSLRGHWPGDSRRCRPVARLDRGSSRGSLGARASDLGQDRHRGPGGLAREQGRDRNRRLEAAAEGAAPAHRIGPPCEPDRDRTPAGGAQDRLQIDRRDTSDVRCICGNTHSRRQARATLPGRLRDRARAQLAGAADAPWQRRRPQSDRRPPADEQDGGLARGHRLCLRRPCLDLGVSSSPATPSRLGGYLSLLPRVENAEAGRLAAADGSAGMAFSGRTKTTVSLVWKAARDNVRVAGYRLFRNGVSVATKATPGYTYKGLKCGTRYTFALVAYDAAGNTSIRAEATGSTSTAACTGGSPPPPPRPPPVAGATIQPGQSWQSAYNAAAANSSLNVAAGNHGEQRLSGNKKVTFVGANGAILRRARRQRLEHHAGQRRHRRQRGQGDDPGQRRRQQPYKNLEIRNNTDVQMVTNGGSSATYDHVSSTTR